MLLCAGSAHDAYAQELSDTKDPLAPFKRRILTDLELQPRLTFPQTSGHAHLKRLHAMRQRFAVTGLEALPDPDVPKDSLTPQQLLHMGIILSASERTISFFQSALSRRDPASFELGYRTAARMVRACLQVSDPACSCQHLWNAPAHDSTLPRA